MRVVIAAAIACAALAAAGSASAQADQGSFALGTQIGSTGGGLEAEVRATNTVVLRGAVEGFSIGRTVNSGGTSYRGRARWFTGSGMLDLHPFSNPFTVIGGVYVGKREVTLSGTPTANVSINGVDFTPAQVGRLEGRAKFSKTAPFAGLGWDTTFHSSSRWGFAIRAGAIFGKTPDVRLQTVGGLAAANAALLDVYVRQQEVAARDKLDKVKIWPVLQIGTNYRF